MTARTHWMTIGGAALAAGLLYQFMSTPDAAAPPPPARAADPFAFVRSMEGTKPDGNIRQNSSGQLVVDAELGHLFDYYLAGLGEKDLGAITREIERELDRRLAPAAAAQAKRLLARYLDYKRALATAEQNLPRQTDLLKAARARLAAQQQLRAGFFSVEEINGLFGFSDAYDADALARLEISQDRRLTPEQRAAKLAALDKQLPAAIREDREAPAKVIRVEESAKELRAKGAGDDEIYRLRAAAFSPEAANRLAEVDREEAAWDGRIKTYLAQRAQVVANEGDVQKLRDQYFSADEQRRLPAYESMNR